MPAQDGPSSLAAGCWLLWSAALFPDFSFFFSTSRMAHHLHSKFSRFYYEVERFARASGTTLSFGNHSDVLSNTNTIGSLCQVHEDPAETRRQPLTGCLNRILPPREASVTVKVFFSSGTPVFVEAARNEVRCRSFPSVPLSSDTGLQRPCALRSFEPLGHRCSWTSLHAFPFICP